METTWMPSVWFCQSKFLKLTGSRATTSFWSDFRKRKWENNGKSLNLWDILAASQTERRKCCQNLKWNWFCLYLTFYFEKYQIECSFFEWNLKLRNAFSIRVIKLQIELSIENVCYFDLWVKENTFPLYSYFLDYPWHFLTTLSIVVQLPPCPCEWILIPFFCWMVSDLFRVNPPDPKKELAGSEDGWILSF